MNLKVTAGPAVIAVSIIVLVAVVYGIYRMSFAPPPHNVSRDNMPAYMKGQGSTYGGQGGQAASGPPGGRPSYARPPSASGGAPATSFGAPPGAGP